MDSASCVVSFGITTYIALSIGIAEWFIFSVGEASLYKSDITTIWNLITSSTLVIVWMKLPILCISYSAYLDNLFRTLAFSSLLLSGPFLFALSILGSIWDTIKYSRICFPDDKCV